MTVFPYYPPPGLQRVTAAVLRSSHHPHLRPLCGPWTGWSSGRATCGLRACSRCSRARSGRTTSLPKCTTARQSAPFAWQRRPELGTRLLAGCPAAAPPRVFELTASIAADLAAFDHAGTTPPRVARSRPSASYSSREPTLIGTTRRWLRPNPNPSPNPEPKLTLAGRAHAAPDSVTQGPRRLCVPPSRGR